MSKVKINEEKIDKLAHLAVKRGVGLQKGQNLLITAPLESLPLVRKIAEHAYKEGAHIVTPLFTDSDITLSRFKYAPDESFDNSTEYLTDLWKNKYAKKRIENLIKNERASKESLFYDDLIYMTWEESKNKYLSQVGR